MVLLYFIVTTLRHEDDEANMLFMMTTHTSWIFYTCKFCVFFVWSGIQPKLFLYNSVKLPFWWNQNEVLLLIAFFTCLNLQNRSAKLFKLTPLTNDNILHFYFHKFHLENVENLICKKVSCFEAPTLSIKFIMLFWGFIWVKRRNENLKWLNLFLLRLSKACNGRKFQLLMQFIKWSEASILF